MVVRPNTPTYLTIVFRFPSSERRRGREPSILGSRISTRRIPCADFRKADPWTGVPGAFLGILGRIELPEATATSSPTTPRQLGHSLRLT
jgi:hypothetical protein